MITCLRPINIKRKATEVTVRLYNLIMLFFGRLFSSRWVCVKLQAEEFSSFQEKFIVSKIIYVSTSHISFII